MDVGFAAGAGCGRRGWRVGFVVSDDAKDEGDGEHEEDGRGREG